MGAGHQRLIEGYLRLGGAAHEGLAFRKSMRALLAASYQNELGEPLHVTLVNDSVGADLHLAARVELEKRHPPASVQDAVSAVQIHDAISITFSLDSGVAPRNGRIEKNEIVRAVPAKAHAVDARRAEQKLLLQVSRFLDENLCHLGAPRVGTTTAR